jgi:hypothetical protein
MKRQYWLVGATWGNDDKLPEFIDGGYWQMGYKDEKQPAMAALRAQIREGDRIAIKSNFGKRSKDIRIRAIGIVEEVDDYGGRVYVRWIVRGIDRAVKSKGCYATIHRPFDAQKDAPWIQEVFMI